MFLLSRSPARIADIVAHGGELQLGDPVGRVGFPPPNGQPWPAKPPGAAVGSKCHKKVFQALENPELTGYVLSNPWHVLI